MVDEGHHTSVKIFESSVFSTTKGGGVCAPALIFSTNVSLIFAAFASAGAHALGLVDHCLIDHLAVLGDPTVGLILIDPEAVRGGAIHCTTVV